MKLRCSGLLKLSCTALVCLVPTIANGAGLALNIADIAATGFAARGISVTLLSGHGKIASTYEHARSPRPNPLINQLAIRLSPQAGKSLVIPQAGEGANDTLRENYIFDGAADLQIASLKVQQHDFKNVRLHCGEFTLTSAQLACRKGRLNAMPDAELDFSYAFDTKRAQLVLSSAGGESWQVSGQLGEGVWQLSARLHNAKIRRLASVLPSKIPSLTQGVLNGTLSISSSGAGADLQFDELAFSDATGLHAAEKLRGNINFSARRSGTDWNWQGNLDWRSGELYWQPLYLKGGHRLSAAGHFNDKRLTVDSATVDLPEVGRVQFSAEWQQGSLISSALHAEGLALDKLFDVYAKPFFASGVLVDAALQGQADVDVQYRSGSVQSLKLKLHGAGISDAQKRYSLYGVNSDFDWQVDVPGSVSIAFAGGSLLGVPLGAGQWTIKTDGLKYSVSQASLPILDGRLDLRDFHLHRTNDAWHWNVAAVLTPISMEQLSLAAGWPRMLGSLSGRIPDVSFDGNQISADGALLFNVFDGTVVATGLKLTDAFGRAPRLSGSLVMRNLDLDMLTRTFAFGSMLGRVDGDINALQLQNWQPVKFDARLYSSQGRYPKKISQKAVQNISSLGGAGAAAAIQRSYLGFFENFGYERIGISCVLRNDLCQMGGIEEGRQGPYVIVRGAGIPAISVIGYNRAVSWGELTTRLKRVMQDNVKPVVK